MCKQSFVVFDSGENSPIEVFKMQRNKIETLEGERNKYRDELERVQATVTRLRAELNRLGYSDEQVKALII